MKIIILSANKKQDQFLCEVTNSPFSFNCWMNKEQLTEASQNLEIFCGNEFVYIFKQKPSVVNIIGFMGFNPFN